MTAISDSPAHNGVRNGSANGTSPIEGQPPIASYPDLKDKVVFGAKIFGCDLYLESAQHTQKRIAAEGGDITVVAADVTNSGSVKAAVDACIAKYGRIDILVNNVGRSEPGGPAEMVEAVWDAQSSVNLKSVYLCCHFILPLMEEQGHGVVVNIASIAGLRYIGKPQVAYAATKAAVIQFTKATAVIYAPKNIRLNVVVPGLMHTPLVGMLADKYAGGDLSGFIAKRNKAVPMGKMGDSFDVAMTAVFLASQQSRYITGQRSWSMVASPPRLANKAI
ncbi:unnamed protein product [Parascedosporium putredinis]|uniref:Uncharacterized protein n=1 Tax=Parascedosporium putredinis TaxID=1442378 RepID=A0A9P1M744_9PEZI|nr:unnamed protein product [Parascedosporium putredinis]CAI7989717.1 unnamed protein product [Parascedosporium putredinis]